jgi:hypothetical protein
VGDKGVKDPPPGLSHKGRGVDSIYHYGEDNKKQNIRKK